MSTSPPDPTPEPPTSPGVRWTEHGPEPLPEAPAPDEIAPAPAPSTETDDIDAIRARLAERGLVRQQPAVRIRELAGEAPARPVPETPPPDNPAPVVVPDEAEEIEREPPGPTSAVSCPSCRSSQQVSTGASGYRCLSCSKVWRWAICSHCAELSMTQARQESWRCSHCSDYSRSWWRTADGRREAPTVVLRRQSDEARRRRAAAQERARRRRWKVVAAGVVLIAATAAWALVVSDRSVPATERGPTGAVCSTASELRSSFASGSVGPADVRVALDDLARAAVEATPEVRVAAQRWAASGQPGDETFTAAQDDLANACLAGA